MWIDSHCHLHYATDFDMAKDALENNIKHLMCVATKVSDYETLKALKKQYSNFINISLGQHPCDINDPNFNYKNFEEIVKTDKNIIAIGETGFDIQGDLKMQRKFFDLHAEIANKFELPIILHTRDVEEETISALKNWPALKGVFHCFTGSAKLADFAQEIGWKISFSGIVTFKSAEYLRDIAKNILLENMLIETDAPFLAPVPMRGKPNKASYVKYVGEFIASLLNKKNEDFAKIMETNYFNLFKERKS